MKYQFVPYRHSSEAFLEVENFLASSVTAFEQPRNWYIDRWNFTFTVSRVMHGASIPEWEACIGLWRDDAGKLVAMAHEEEQNGDVFFEFDRPETIHEELLFEMFAFAEKNCLKKRDGGRGFGIRIPQHDTLTAELALDRGYRKGDWSEPTAVRPIPSMKQERRTIGTTRATEPTYKDDPFGSSKSTSLTTPEKLPDLRLIEGLAVKPDRKALAHARAFGYAERIESIPPSIEAFKALLSAPSYRPELDLAFEDEQGDIACFVGLWFDPVSKTGILEPVGTIPAYRRRGLARELITEGERRLHVLGAERLIVGSDQPFYLAIGFLVYIRQDVWEYRG